MIDIFKHVFLAPLTGFIIAIPLVYLFDCAGFLDNLSFFCSYVVGVAAVVGFLIGNVIEIRVT